MVFLLSDKENKTNNLIMESFKSENSYFKNGKDRGVSVVSVNNSVKIQGDKGIVIVTGSINKFKKQEIPSGFLGVCTENDKNALKLFKKNKLSVITCGTGSKNTLSISSITENDMLLCLQRSVKDINGDIVEPCEIKADKTKDLFCLLATVAVMLYYKIAPNFCDGIIL